MDYTVVGIHFITAECLLESAVTKFKDIIPLLLHFSIPCAKTVQSSYLKSTAAEVDYLAVTFILQSDVQGTTQPWGTMRTVTEPKADLKKADNEGVGLAKRLVLKAAAAWVAGLAIRQGLQAGIEEVCLGGQQFRKELRGHHGWQCLRRCGQSSYMAGGYFLLRRWFIGRQLWCQKPLLMHQRINELAAPTRSRHTALARGDLR